uniref:HTH CENPB-type domain-containing protein n=1 Tax=Timema shepardi TaxID=629360 RepID=A0A7R9ALM9_TIMSH|nr:unnamed protein product [Timema shepardi]
MERGHCQDCEARGGASGDLRPPTDHQGNEGGMVDLPPVSVAGLSDEKMLILQKKGLVMCPDMRLCSGGGCKGCLKGGCPILVEYITLCWGGKGGWSAVSRVVGRSIRRWICIPSPGPILTDCLWYGWIHDLSVAGLATLRVNINAKCVEDKQVLSPGQLYGPHSIHRAVCQKPQQLIVWLAERNNIPNQFKEGVAGRSWLDHFLSRHKQQMSLRPTGTSYARVEGFTKEMVLPFFNLLESEYEKHRYVADRIWNVDKTGLSLVQSKVPQVIGLKGKRQIGAMTVAECGSMLLNKKIVKVETPGKIRKKQPRPGVSVETLDDLTMAVYSVSVERMLVTHDAIDAEPRLIAHAEPPITQDVERLSLCWQHHFSQAFVTCLSAGPMIGALIHRVRDFGGLEIKGSFDALWRVSYLRLGARSYMQVNTYCSVGQVVPLEYPMELTQGNHPFGLLALRVGKHQRVVFYARHGADSRHLVTTADVAGETAHLTHHSLPGESHHERGAVAALGWRGEGTYQELMTLGLREKEPIVLTKLMSDLLLVTEGALLSSTSPSSLSMEPPCRVEDSLRKWSSHCFDSINHEPSLNTKKNTINFKSTNVFNHSNNSAEMWPPGIRLGAIIRFIPLPKDAAMLSCPIKGMLSLSTVTASSIWLREYTDALGWSASQQLSQLSLQHNWSQLMLLVGLQETHRFINKKVVVVFIMASSRKIRMLTEKELNEIISNWESATNMRDINDGVFSSSSEREPKHEVDADNNMTQIQHHHLFSLMPPLKLGYRLLAVGNVFQTICVHVLAKQFLLQYHQGKPYKGQVKSSESSIGSGWYSVGCSDVSVVDVKVGGVRWATHFWFVWSGAVSYCGPVQTRKPGMTVFSRRREELQHSSCSTSRISRSVSTLKHCPWPWMGPPKNKASNCRKRCSPGTSVAIHTSASLETAATESCCGAGLATGSDIEGHYNMAHLQEIPLLLRSNEVKYPTLHSTTIPGDSIFHLVEKWHLVTRIKSGRTKAWLRSGLVEIVRPSALGIQVHLKVASVGLKGIKSLHIIKAVEETI